MSSVRLFAGAIAMIVVVCGCQSPQQVDENAAYERESARLKGIERARREHEDREKERATQKLERNAKMMEEGMKLLDEQQRRINAGEDVGVVTADIQRRIAELERR